MVSIEICSRQHNNNIIINKAQTMRRAELSRFSFYGWRAAIKNLHFKSGCRAMTNAFLQNFRDTMDSQSSSHRQLSIERRWKKIINLYCSAAHRHERCKMSIKNFFMFTRISVLWFIAACSFPLSSFTNYIHIVRSCAVVVAVVIFK